jgi:UDP-3-O-[3-hydroxymyristoyl] N-acetylglucosamine deacetylase / 3-hydroxyacyl-[acyl-carrier-protein] dehydratase
MMRRVKRPHPKRISSCPNENHQAGRAIVTQQQRTLNAIVEIPGSGLFTGQDVLVRCLPAEPDTGLVFVRTDLDGAPAIPGTIASVAEGDVAGARCSGIQKGEAQVVMIEHLLAGLFGLGIDNLRIEVDAVEMPVGDGSAMTYVTPLLEVGTVEQGVQRKPLVIDQPIVVCEEDILLVAAPQDEGLTITYTLDYGDKFLKSQSLTVTIDEETFLKEIAPARTYCLRPEIDFFKKIGLGGGASAENTVVVELDGTISDNARFADECVRHKILDLLGDLYLAGRLASGRLMGYKSGHATNARLARKLSQAK